MILAMVEILIVGLGRLSDDHYDKNHKYEGWTGYLMVLFYVG